METFRLLMAPPTDKACIFFDLKGFGIKQMDVVSLLYLVKVLESYYPESLAKMYISNAPYIFWGFWRVVKNILDPVVRNKIVFITGPAETGDHVPETRMIKYCGGKVESEFDFVDPKEGENDVQKDTATKQKLQDRHHRLTDQFEKITREWCSSGGKDQELNEKRQVLIKKLRLSQFELEPYTRGLTAYHRNGVLPMESPGIATFDYIIGGKTTRQIIGKATCRKSIERELCEIVDGSTTEKAEEKTKEMLRNGTWGQWRVNDNSPEIKAKAVATLDDLEGNARPEQLEKAAKAAAPAEKSKSSKVDQQKTDEYREEAEEAGVGAAAGGGAAAAAATSGQAKRKSSSVASPPRARKEQQQATPASASTSSSNNTAVNSNTQQEPLVFPYTSTRKARKMMKQSASGGTLNSTGQKKGFFGSLRAKIAAL
jgi:hypothetical protein